MDTDISTLPTQSLASFSEGLPLPSSLQSESWFFAMLLALFALMVLAVRVYPSFVTEGFRTMLRAVNPSVLFGNPEGRGSRFRFLYVVFAFCTIGLYAYVAISRPEEGEGFPFAKYPLFLSATVVFFLLKDLFIRLLCFTFFDERVRRLSSVSYYNAVAFCGLALFPLLFLRVYIPLPAVDFIRIVCMVVIVLIYILFVLRLFRIFYSKLSDVFYLLLYLCTLEIIPLAVLFEVYWLMA